MAKIKLKAGGDYQQLGEVILAVWYRMLDKSNPNPPQDILKRELEAIARDVLDDENGGLTFNVVFDTDRVLNIVIPYLPYDESKQSYVATTDDLIEYLRRYHDDTSGRHYDEELGQAVVFGCGR